MVTLFAIMNLLGQSAQVFFKTIFAVLHHNNTTLLQTLHCARGCLEKNCTKTISKIVIVLLVVSAVYYIISTNHKHTVKWNKNFCFCPTPFCVDRKQLNSIPKVSCYKDSVYQSWSIPTVVKKILFRDSVSMIAASNVKVPKETDRNKKHGKSNQVHPER